MPYDFSPAGFPQVFSAMVADAAMMLPPLTREGDDEFLLAMMQRAIMTFWEEYREGLPKDVVEEVAQAFDADDGQKVEQWFLRYANFQEDPEAAGLATVILDDLAEKLPALLKQEYDAFHSSVVPS